MNGHILALAPQGAALIVDGELDDLILEPKEPQPRVGDIHTAKITRALPGKGGAFCEWDGGTGFIREAKGLKSGDQLSVQVSSLPEPGKATTVSPRVLYKGPRLILTPGAPGVNVSRQIKDRTERDRLEAGASAALESIGVDSGVIVRTGAEGEDGVYLQRELETLAVRMKSGTGGGSAHDIATREWLTSTPDQILATADTVRWLKDGGLWGDDRLERLIVTEKDPFEAAGVWEAIERLKSPHAPNAAGSIIVEPTRALVAVDVNTEGNFTAAAGLKANMAAARDLPRQLRLRGLGGQIVVDFAPMAKNERRALEGAIRAAFKRDPIETSLVGWTQMGLYELQRKRERRPLAEVL